MQPTYFVKHPDGTFSEADPQPTPPKNFIQEECTLQAIHTGEGWCLQVSYPEGHELNGEAIALLAWPRSWPDSVNTDFLDRAGFEAC